MKNSLLLIILCFLFIQCKNTQNIVEENPNTKVNDTSQTITSIALGSCNHHDDPQPLWSDIVSNKPDLWVWLGDIVYGDTQNMDLLESKYTAQKQKTEYQQLLKSNTDILGIWDDHDYGKNNGGKEYPKKAESRDKLFDFLDIPAESMARKREGAYTSHTYGIGDQQVKIILLDARYFRDPPNSSGTGTILGEDQWLWLAQELRNSEAQLHLIGSGIQIIPNDHTFEKWGRFPSERERLFDLLVETNTSNVLFMSGDRHIAEFSKIKWMDNSQYFYEITASGMTHFYENFPGETNQNRMGDWVADYNFGLLNIDWEAQPLEVTMQIKGLGNEVLEESKAIF